MDIDKCTHGQTNDEGDDNDDAEYWMDGRQTEKKRQNEYDRCMDG